MDTTTFKSIFALLFIMSGASAALSAMLLYFKPENYPNNNTNNTNQTNNSNNNNRNDAEHITFPFPTSLQMEKQPLLQIATPLANEMLEQAMEQSSSSSSASSTSPTVSQYPFFVNNRNVNKRNQNLNDAFLLYIPIPRLLKIFFKSLFPPNTLNQNKNKKTPSTYLLTEADRVNYLNNISQNIDYLYRNFIRYRTQLQYHSNTFAEQTNSQEQPSQTMLSTPMHQWSVEYYEKMQKHPLVIRLKPLFMKVKFLLAKELMLQDVKDELSYLELNQKVKKKQMSEIVSRMPPQFPFLLKAKFTPFYWILTEEDYMKMNYSLRNTLFFEQQQHYQTMDSMFHSNTTTASGVSSNDTQFLHRKQFTMNNYGYYGNNNLNAIQFELEFDNYCRRLNVKRRFHNLLQKYLQIHPEHAKLNYREKVEQFCKYSFDYLTNRVQEANKLLKQLRLELRQLQRDKLRKQYEWNRLKQLSLLE